MKKTRLICAALAVIMLLASFTMLASAEDAATAVTPIYYPNGTIILQEADLKDADLTKYFQAVTDSPADNLFAAISFNKDTDRLQIKAPTKPNTVTNMITVPKNLLNYTMIADIYMTENPYGNNAIMGIGINSADTWSRSTYFQTNVYTSDPVKYWVNNYNSEGKNNGGNVGATGEAKYELGTKITVKFQVTPESVTVYYNDIFFTIFKTEKLGYAFGTGTPFFIQRQNTTIEIDNLLIYSGVGEPDYTKTMANQPTLTAPEVETEPPATETEPTATDTAAPETNDTKATEADTSADTSADTTGDTSGADDGGCGGAIGMGILGVIALAGATAFVGKRRR